MPRAIWKGALSFGLVNIPIELHTAVRDHRPHFRMLHAKDRSPVRFERVCVRDGTPVAWIARNGDVHGFDGDYLGWLQDGMLWDRQGRCALFSPQAQGGPSKPALRPEPPPSSFKEIPNRRSPEYPNSRPRRSSKWADVTDDGFFCPPARDYTPMRIVRRFPRGR